MFANVYRLPGYTGLLSLRPVSPLISCLQLQLQLHSLYGQSCKTSMFRPDRHSAQPDSDIPPLILFHLTPDQPLLTLQARPLRLPVKPCYLRGAAAGYTAVGEGTRFTSARSPIRQLNETYSEETKLTNLYSKHGAAARPKAIGAEVRRERASKLIEGFSVYDETCVPL